HGHILDTAEIFDPSTRRWSATGSMHLPRLGFTLTVLRDGEVLAAGGASTTRTAGTAGGQAVRITRSARVYDPTTGRGTSARSLTVARLEATGAALPSGGALIAGGFGGAPVGGRFPTLASTESYDPARATFTAAASLSQGRADQDAVVLASGAVLVT